ncbi:MAG: PspA/IM30 family protein [Cyclobacteriaceae bacterium]|nr:PspA/IM30 family protein [Cyclobacteriaceae bacterium]
MNIFKRIFKIGQAETNSALNQLEDPIKMTEQGIRDLKEDLEKSLKALAEVKAMAIRCRNDVEVNKNKGEDYEQKAIMLLKRGQDGSLEMAEADRLASEALVKKEECMVIMGKAKEDHARLESNLAQMDGNVKKLRQTISHYENELKTLKARVKVSSATKNLNKQLANIDADSTVGMLERMREKVEQEEALAESFGEIANESRSIDDEIDKALASDDVTVKASDELTALKEKLGISK